MWYNFRVVTKYIDFILPTRSFISTVSDTLKVLIAFILKLILSGLRYGTAIIIIILIIMWNNINSLCQEVLSRKLYTYVLFSKK